MKNPFGKPEQPPERPRTQEEREVERRASVQKDIEKAGEEDRKDQERKKEEWPRERKRLEEQRQQLAAQIEATKNEIEQQRANMVKYEAGALKLQLHFREEGDPVQKELVRERDNLRAMNRMAGENIERLREEALRLGAKADEIEGKITSGNEAFGG